MDYLNKVIVGDCLEQLKLLPESSVDSVVTDPPYELGFMGKLWDNTGIANNPLMWAECLRVLKPGGYLLSFGGTRTYHRMASAIEDAGFEVRDMIEWCYGSGFPKSLNIGKAVDKLQGNEREVTGSYKVPDIRGDAYGTMNEKQGGSYKNIEVNKTKGTSEWEGWGTALKPAHEPICMARKPLAEKTVAENVLKYGTGGINIDESRVGTEVITINGGGKKWRNNGAYTEEVEPINEQRTGRFPANLIHDNSEEVRECFPETKSGNLLPGHKRGDGTGNSLMGGGGVIEGTYGGDSGNASRFFRAIPQVVDLNDFSIYNRSILTNIKQLCGQHLTKKKTGIMLGGVIKEAEKFIQDAELLMSGNNTTIEKFLTDIVFTTKTLIAQMTELKTLAVLPNWLITKFTEESEKTINSLKELNTEDVKSAKSIFLLQTFISEVLENIRAIAEIVVEQDSNSGEWKSLLYQAKASKSERNKGCEGLETKDAGASMNTRCATCGKQKLDHETSRCKCEVHIPAEMKSKEGMKNNHPTVKPIALMEYLIKMVTPKGGVVLDPFAGSGSTLVAAKQNGFHYIGIELTPEYIPIIEARLNATRKESTLF